MKQNALQHQGGLVPEEEQLYEKAINKCRLLHGSEQEYQHISGFPVIGRNN